MKDIKNDMRGKIEITNPNPAQILQAKLVMMEPGQYFMINDNVLGKQFLILCVSPDKFIP